MADFTQKFVSFPEGGVKYILLLFCNIIAVRVGINGLFGWERFGLLAGGMKFDQGGI
jgi:hypothetical protein